MAEPQQPSGRYRRVLGILGGLGPHAHVELERRLLAAVAGAAADQDYPEWLLSSLPRTPDRTEALLGRGPSPVPLLVESCRRLEGRVDFAVLACITAHAFLAELRREVSLPILDVIGATLDQAVKLRGERARIGVLATTGTLKSGLFAEAARRAAPGVTLLTLPDLPDGAHLQEELVMRSIYGPERDGKRLGGGVKAGAERDPLTGVPHRDSLAEAARLLAREGAGVIILGCTEIPLALRESPVPDLPLLDPMQVAAETALSIARGELPLPT